MLKHINFIITVIVPVFNVENYLEECIDSILNQSITQLQIILIDDGSKDSSGKICDVYASKDNRIEVIHQNNRGVSVARNVGIKKAKGKYLFFVDADDILPKNALSNLLKKIEGQNEMVIGVVQKITEEKELFFNGRFQTKEILQEDFLLDLFNETKYPYLGYPVAKLFNRKIVQLHNIYFNPKIALNEDRLFILEYMLHVSKVIVCDEVVYFYRQRSTGVIQESRRNVTVDDNEMTVLLSFDEMKKICYRYSKNLYYICSRKAFESSLDLLNRVDKKDREKIRRIVSFMWENSKICLKNPNYTLLAKTKILAHTILKK